MICLRPFIHRIFTGTSVGPIDKHSIRAAAMLFSIYLCIFIYLLTTFDNETRFAYRLPSVLRQLNIASWVTLISLASHGADVMWPLFKVKLKLRPRVAPSDVTFVPCHETRWSGGTYSHRWRHVSLLAFLKKEKLDKLFQSGFTSVYSFEREIDVIHT
jgi:hypothetical protein